MRREIGTQHSGAAVPRGEDDGESFIGGTLDREVDRFAHDLGRWSMPHPQRVTP